MFTFLSLSLGALSLFGEWLQWDTQLGAFIKGQLISLRLFTFTNSNRNELTQVPFATSLRYCRQPQQAMGPSALSLGAIESAFN